MVDTHVTQNGLITRNELELDRFMTLAEDISRKIETLTEKRSRLITYATGLIILSGLIVGTLIYGSQIGLFENHRIFSNILSGILVLFCLINAVKLLNITKKINQDIKHEAFILGDLLNITDSYKEKLLNRNDTAKKAYFDMRMSRIDFTQAKFKKQAQSTQPIQQEIKQPRTTPIPESQSF